MPPYADLSRFAPAAAQLENDCGVAVGALVRADAGSARVLATIAFAEPGAGIYVVGRMRLVEGRGKLSAYLWDDEPLVNTMPFDSGRVVMLGVTSIEDTKVGFLGQADQGEALVFEVREVVITTIEVRQ